MEVQNVSSPTTDCELSKQQSVSGSKPSKSGQLSDPHVRVSWHWSWVSQSPSFSEQVLQLQNAKSPLLHIQLTEERALIIGFYEKNEISTCNPV